MTSLSNIDSNLEKLPLKDYFKTIESIVTKDTSVEELTNFFTIKPYSETKPYLTRRHLIPMDKRFKEIEIVYKTARTAKAIVWNLNIFLSQLVDMFGEPIIHNEPYSDSTAFAFKSINPGIEIITTRHLKWLTKLADKNGFGYQDEQHKIQLLDPEFTFIQFSLKS